MATAGPPGSPNIHPVYRDTIWPIIPTTDVDERCEQIAVLEAYADGAVAYLTNWRQMVLSAILADANTVRGDLEIGDRLGVGDATVRNWSRGRGNLTLGMLFRLDASMSRVFGLEPGLIEATRVGAWQAAITVVRGFLVNRNSALDPPPINLTPRGCWALRLMYGTPGWAGTAKPPDFPRRVRAIIEVAEQELLQSADGERASREDALSPSILDQLDLGWGLAHLLARLYIAADDFEIL